MTPQGGGVDVRPGQLIIAHTNDLHAHYGPNRADWLEGTPDIGGFGAIGGHVAALHQEHGDDRVLVLDGGDVMTGTPLMEFEVRGARGGAMLELMETAGMDAWVLGNHEFDIGMEHISTIVSASQIPVLSANLDSADGSGAPAIMGVQDHTIFERNGLRVGVFGLTTTSLGRLTASGAAARMDVRDLAEVAREQVALLEPQVDLVVALTHVGLQDDKELADAVEGIDLIIGGHSHTSLTEPVRVDDTWIVQAGGYARQLGVVELTVDAGRIVDFSAELRDLHPDKSPIHAASARLEKTWTERISSHFGAVIGRVEGGNLDREYGAESPMGRWASDTVRLAAGADIGLYNPGGLRADIVEGPLTRGALYNVFPFGNTVVHFDITGAELVGLLLKNASAELAQDHPVMQLSGITAEWRLRSGVPDLVEVTVGGRPLLPEASYTLATNSYIADQWRYNLGFEPQDVTHLEQTIFQAAMARAVEGPVVPPSDLRMRRSD